MKKIVLSIMLVVCAYYLVGCAGMPMQDQRNMGTNAAIWGAIGAGSGALIAAATGGNPVKGAVVGGLAGAGLGAINTPTAYGSGYGYDIDCSRLGTMGERASCERGQADTRRQIQYERERSAYDLGRGGYYPTGGGYYPNRGYRRY